MASYKIRNGTKRNGTKRNGTKRNGTKRNEMKLACDCDVAFFSRVDSVELHFLVLLKMSFSKQLRAAYPSSSLCDSSSSSEGTLPPLQKKLKSKRALTFGGNAGAIF